MVMLKQAAKQRSHKAALVFMQPDLWKAMEKEVEYLDISFEKFVNEACLLYVEQLKKDKDNEQSYLMFSEMQLFKSHAIPIEKKNKRNSKGYSSDQSQSVSPTGLKYSPIFIEENTQSLDDEIKEIEYLLKQYSPSFSEESSQILEDGIDEGTNIVSKISKHRRKSSVSKDYTKK